MEITAHREHCSQEMLGTLFTGKAAHGEHCSQEKLLAGMLLVGNTAHCNKNQLENCKPTMV